MEKRKASCKQCGKEFEYYFSSHQKERVFCGRECRQKSLRVYQICPVCQKQYRTGSIEKRKYCSRECSFAAFKQGALRSEDWGSNWHKICETCGKEFHPKPGR